MILQFQQKIWDRHIQIKALSQIYDRSNRFQAISTQLTSNLFTSTVMYNMFIDNLVRRNWTFYYRPRSWEIVYLVASIRPYVRPLTAKPFDLLGARLCRVQQRALRVITSLRCLSVISGRMRIIVWMRSIGF